MSGHTPGPWRPSKLTKSWGVYDADGTSVAKVGDAFGVAAERREADARLIAAAPALLEALELLMREVDEAGLGEANDFGWPKAVKA